MLLLHPPPAAQHRRRRPSCSEEPQHHLLQAPPLLWQPAGGPGPGSGAVCSPARKQAKWKQSSGWTENPVGLWPRGPGSVKGGLLPEESGVFCCLQRPSWDKQLVCVPPSAPCSVNRHRRDPAAEALRARRHAHLVSAR